jgi:ABC-type multidrug transport system fused ATPase/permease subunit
MSTCWGEEERISDALRLMGLVDVVNALPDSIETVVGAGLGGATDLSGGQWQRLALARLLYHDAPLLVLDEPSASLDPLGERQIFRLLADLGQDRSQVLRTVCANRPNSLVEGAPIHAVWLSVVPSRKGGVGAVRIAFTTRYDL